MPTNKPWFRGTSADANANAAAAAASIAVAAFSISAGDDAATTTDEPPSATLLFAFVMRGSLGSRLTPGVPPDPASLALHVLHGPGRCAPKSQTPAFGCWHAGHMKPNPLPLPLLRFGDDADDSTIFTAPTAGGGLTDGPGCDVACSCDENAQPRAISAESDCRCCCCCPSPTSAAFVEVGGVVLEVPPTSAPSPPPVSVLLLLPTAAKVVSLGAAAAVATSEA